MPIPRYSMVNNIRMTTIAFSSVFEIGDSNAITGYSRVFAVQRETELFYASEGHFTDPVFVNPIPLPPINPNISLDRINISPFIKVNNVDIKGASASSVVHIGNTKNVYMEARVKNIRQLENHEVADS